MRCAPHRKDPVQALGLALRCGARTRRVRRQLECHLYFARRVSFLSCADTFESAPDHWPTFAMSGNQPPRGPREFSERRLMFALGLGAAVLHGFSSTAGAAYWGTPPEVPDALP